VLRVKPIGVKPKKRAGKGGGGKNKKTLAFVAIDGGSLDSQTGVKGQKNTTKNPWGWKEEELKLLEPQNRATRRKIPDQSLRHPRKKKKKKEKML